MVEDIRQFLDALKIQRVVLVGHSIAGDELTRFAVVHSDRVIKLVYLDAAYDRTRMPEINKQPPPPEMGPTETESGSLDGMRHFVKRMNNSWSEAFEASLREQFSSDGKTFLNAAEKARAVGLVKQGTFESHSEFARIRSPALSFAVVGFTSRMSDLEKTLPDPSRKSLKEFLSNARQFMQQETEHFRKEIPNGRVVEFTNTDHHCFIQREDEVVREMREFLAP